MGRENRFKNLLTRLNKQANFCKLQSYKHVAISNYQTKLFRNLQNLQNLAKYSQNYPYQAQIQSFQPTPCSKIHNQNSCFITQIIKEQILYYSFSSTSLFLELGLKLFLSRTHVPPLATAKFNFTCPFNSFRKLPSIPPHQAFTENIIFESKK